MTRLLILLTLSLLTASCSASSQRHYIMRIFLVELHDNNKENPYTELKDRRINICFTDTQSRPICFKDVDSGKVLDIQSRSASIAISSIELLGTPNYQYEFAASDAPRIIISEHTEAVYMGRMLVDIGKAETGKQPRMGLFSGCVKQEETIDGMIKFNFLRPNVKVKAQCFDIGKVYNKGTDKPVSLLLNVPPKK